jgi:hypothetical protein
MVPCSEIRTFLVTDNNFETFPGEDVRGTVFLHNDEMRTTINTMPKSDDVIVLV